MILFSAVLCYYMTFHKSSLEKGVVLFYLPLYEVRKKVRMDFNKKWIMILWLRRNLCYVILIKRWWGDYNE